MIKLDYTLKTVEERMALVNKFLEENPNPGPSYLEALADYVVLFAAQQEAKEARIRQRTIITENRTATINKREVSFESLAAQFESGEDGIYGMMTEDANIIFQPKLQITKKDIEKIPELRQVREAIKNWKQILQTCSGRDAYIAKSAIIELSKDQYIIKDSFLKPTTLIPSFSAKFPQTIDGEVTIDSKLHCLATGFSFFDPKIIEIILCNYSKLKATAEGHFEKDIWAIMQDFDYLCGQALAQYPYYERLVEYKIDKKQNLEIQALLEKEFGIKNTVEYLSALWRNKIPKIIASKAEDLYLLWYYQHKNDDSTKWKVCSKCGQRKIASEKFFSKNKTSKDGFYSICKDCRSNAYKEKVNKKKGVHNA